MIISLAGGLAVAIMVWIAANFRVTYPVWRTNLPGLYVLAGVNRIVSLPIPLRLFVVLAVNGFLFAVLVYAAWVVIARIRRSVA